MTQSSLLASKSHLRKLMREVLRSLSVEEKARQTSIVIEHLLNVNQRLADAKHIAVFLSMKAEEINTQRLIEKILGEHKHKHIYVPHVEMGGAKTATSASEMVFFELESLEKYHTEMNENNRFQLRQFNSTERLVKVDERKLDLIIVPGLAFDTYDHQETGKRISRLGRGKGYYDVFLSKIPECYTMGIGFNEQFIPLNKDFSNQRLVVPVDPQRDVLLNEYLCEKTIL